MVGDGERGTLWDGDAGEPEAHGCGVWTMEGDGNENVGIGERLNVGGGYGAKGWVDGYTYGELGELCLGGEGWRRHRIEFNATKGYVG